MFFNFLATLVKNQLVYLSLSPPQRFKFYKSAVRTVSQAQSQMDRSGGEPPPDVRHFSYIDGFSASAKFDMTAWNSQKPNAYYVATVCICFFEV